MRCVRCRDSRGRGRDGVKMQVVINKTSVKVNQARMLLGEDVQGTWFDTVDLSGSHCEPDSCSALFCCAKRLRRQGVSLRCFTGKEAGV